jgi:hypothetical protein
VQVHETLDVDRGLKGSRQNHPIADKCQFGPSPVSVVRELSNMEQSHRRAHDVMVQRAGQVPGTGRHISGRNLMTQIADVGFKPDRGRNPPRKETAYWLN